MASTDTMDIKTVRRTNLRALLKAKEWGPTELWRAMGRSTYAYWRDLLNTEDKSFGEKIAREIEEGLQLSELALDQPPSRTRPAHPLSPARAKLSPQTMRWGAMKTMKPDELPMQLRVELEDDAMEPEARSGWTVELDRELVPRFGDDVLVYLGNGEYHYRRYRQNPSGGWIAAATNSDFASFESVKDPSMRIVAVMAYVLRPRRAAP